MRLSDTGIIVTGASSGMGKAMAGTFVAEGASVVCSSYEPKRLEEAVEAVGGVGPGEATAVPADVRDWSSVEALIEAAAERLPAIDVLVNNAGITQLHTNPDHERRTVADLSPDAWRSIIETNLTGPFHCTKAVLPRMLGRDKGRLLHMSSSHGFRGRAQRAPYAASKFGLEGFHESLALELEGTGVDSIAFRPPGGGVYSERFGAIGRPPDSFGFPSPNIIVETAVRLAAGAGENGGRYVATEDGTDFEPYDRA